MYNFKLMILILIINSFFIRCEKPHDCDTTCNNDSTSVLRDSIILWKVARPDSNEFRSCAPLVMNDGVVFSFYKDEELSYPMKLAKLNKADGSFIWKWSENGDFHPLYRSMSDNQKFISIHNWFNTFIIKSSNGKTIWMDRTLGKEPRGRIVGDHFYTSITPEDNNDTMYSIRSPLTHLAWDTLFMEVLDNQNFEPGLEPPVLWMHPNGDSILVYQDRKVRKNGSAQRFDIRAFNLSQRRLQWNIDHVNELGGNSSQIPQIVGNYYICDGLDVHCIDLLNGTIKWTNKKAKGIGGSNLLIAEGKVFINLLTKSVIAIDIETGDVAWENTTAGECPLDGGIEYYQGKIYLNIIKGFRAYLFRMDAKTGKIEWEYYSPHINRHNDAGFDLTPPTIDPETGLLYVCDRYYVMCIRPPK